MYSYFLCVGGLLRKLTKIRKPLPHSWQWLLGGSSILIILILYTYLSYKQHQINPLDTSMPTWSQLGGGLHTIFRWDEDTGTRMIVEDFVATSSRLVLGLACVVVTAVFIGMHMGSFGVVESFFLPLFKVVAKITPTAMLPVFFALVGVEMELYVAILMFGLVPSLAIAISQALEDFTDEDVDKALTLGASHFEVVWGLMFWSVLPRILATIRAHVGPALVYLLAAELLFADDGFGPRIRLEARGPNMAVVFPYIATLALVGVAIEQAWNLLERGVEFLQMRRVKRFLEVRRTLLNTHSTNI